MERRSAETGQALEHAMSTSGDPFAATRGVDALVSTGCTVRRAGCPLLQDGAVVCLNDHFCLRCVFRVPHPPDLLFVNATDTVPLVHADPSCFFVGNSGGQAARVCKHCFGTMPPQEEPSAADGVGAAASSGNSRMP